MAGEKLKEYRMVASAIQWFTYTHQKFPRKEHVEELLREQAWVEKDSIREVYELVRTLVVTRDPIQRMRVIAKHRDELATICEPCYQRIIRREAPPVNAVFQGPPNQGPAKSKPEPPTKQVETPMEILARAEAAVKALHPESAGIQNADALLDRFTKAMRNSPNASKAMIAALKEPDFRERVNKMLRERKKLTQALQVRKEIRMLGTQQTGNSIRRRTQIRKRTV